MPDVSLLAPSDYTAQAQDIERRRKLAEMLQMGSLEPTALPQTPAGGFTPSISPLSGIAKVMQAYLGAQGQSQATDQQKALAAAMRADRSATVEKAMGAMQGTPERTLGSNDPGDAPINYPAQAPNPQAGYGILAGSSDPGLAQMGLSQMFKSMEPYTLGRDAVRIGPNNQPIASNVQPNFKPVETTGPDGRPVTSFVDMNKPPQQAMPKPVENTYQNLGGQTVAVPKYGDAPATLQHTQTPDNAATIANAQEQGNLNRALTERGQNLVNVRASEQNGIANSNKNTQLTESIRKEFNSLPEVQNYKQVLPIIESAQRAPDTPAGDIDLIYGVGKVMDPNSVVREGELNLVIKSGSPAQRFQGMANYVRGGGRLAPEQRAELMQVMQSRVGALENNYNAARNSYTNILAQQNLKPEQVFTDLPQSYKGPERRQPQSGAIIDGYRFKGGDAANRANWEKV